MLSITKRTTIKVSVLTGLINNIDLPLIKYVTISLHHISFCTRKALRECKTGSGPSPCCDPSNFFSTSPIKCLSMTRLSAFVLSLCISFNHRAEPYISSLRRRRSPRLRPWWVGGCALHFGSTHKLNQFSLVPL